MLINFAIEVTNTDTVVRENGVIVIGKNNTTYQSTNSTWILTEAEQNKLVFENDTLSYANIIKWWQSDNGHWMTELINPTSRINYDIVPADWLEYKIDQYVSDASRQ